MIERKRLSLAAVVRMVLFSACLSVFLAVPVQRYVAYRAVERGGQLLSFRVEGVDPYHPFMGRFLRLRLMPDHFLTPDWNSLMDLHEGYAVFRTGADGCAELVSLTKTPPPDAPACWKIAVNGRSRGRQNGQWTDRNAVSLVYPVDRFYVTESLAPEAEKLFLKAASEKRITADVRLLNGVGIITQIRVDGVPLTEFLRSGTAKNERPSSLP